MTVSEALARMFGGDDPASEMVEAALSIPTGRAMAALIEAAVAWHGPSASSFTADRVLDLEAAVDRWLALGDET